jgi:hypothetical protein
VRDDVTVCPFCAVAVSFEPAAPTPTAIGRLTRAAVFAGAAAAAACGSSKPKTAHDLPKNTMDAGGAGHAEEQPVDAAPVPIQEHNVPMPYGAPPARDRLV